MALFGNIMGPPEPETISWNLEEATKRIVGVVPGILYDILPEIHTDGQSAFAARIPLGTKMKNPRPTNLPLPPKSWEGKEVSKNTTALKALIGIFPTCFPLSRNHELPLAGRLDDPIFQQTLSNKHHPGITALIQSWCYSQEHTQGRSLHTGNPILPTTTKVVQWTLGRGMSLKHSLTTPLHKFPESVLATTETLSMQKSY